jgi:(p)ppGpp synthase/HD superfamily hydrolase
MSSAHTKTGAVGILGLQAGEDVNMSLLVLQHPLVVRADVFATRAHAAIGQLQPYTGLHYCEHTRAVARLLAEFFDDPELVAAGHLHDTIEDPKVSKAELQQEFGGRVARLVDDVSKKPAPHIRNRAERAQAEAARLATVEPDSKNLKCADADVNIDSIVERAPDFARVYVLEKRLLLPSLVGAHPELHARLEATIERAERALRERFSRRARP